MKTCLNCGCSLTYEKRNNKFCGSSCAAVYNNKNRKGKYTYHLSKEGLENIIKSNKLKIGIPGKLKPKECLNCKKSFINNNRRLKFCSDDCKKTYLDFIKKDVSDETRLKLSNSLKNFYNTDKGKINRMKLSEIGIGKNFSEETRNKISIKTKKRCEDPNERIRLREIGRKGGFGKKGLTKGGIFFQSSLEEKCFSFLEDNNIIFESHKVLPESNRICDIYFPDKKLWIELDGINREKKKKWLGKDYDSWIEKLDEYKIKNLNYVILYNFTEFIKYCQIVQLVQNACVTRKWSWARFPL